MKTLLIRISDRPDDEDAKLGTLSVPGFEAFFVSIQYRVSSRRNDCVFSHVGLPTLGYSAAARLE